jgi:hypothetical protein
MKSNQSSDSNSLLKNILMTATGWSTHRAIIDRQRFARTLALLCAMAIGTTGCGSGSSEMPSTSVVAATLLVQPADQSVPMGLSAAFSVSATGTSLQYQWAKNGTPINGATANTYVTPPAQFADTGASFTVMVSNPAGMLTSRAASLTVTARAPTAGDLRFQQVDAPSTVNGWGNAGVPETTNLIARGATDSYPAIGSAFWVGSGGNCAMPPVTDGTGCEWTFSVVPLAMTASSPSLLVGYASDTYDNFEADLQNPAWPSLGNGATPAAPFSVITSLDLEPADVLFGLSWTQSAQQTTFELSQNTVTAANLQAAMAQEGAMSRVVTAISANGDNATYLSYGWQADTTTLYEAQVTTASPANAPSAAASLAAQGYIITATGLADSTGDIFLVGTRVQGDTMPRQFVAARSAAQLQTMMQQGYAIVGLIFNSAESDYLTYLGER